MPKLGLTLAPSNKMSGAEGSGVVVTAVDPSGVAADHGFQVGDVILDVGGKSVSNPSDVRKQLADARKEGKRALHVPREVGRGHPFRRYAARQRMRRSRAGECGQRPVQLSRGSRVMGRSAGIRRPRWRAYPGDGP